MRPWPRQALHAPDRCLVQGVPLGSTVHAHCTQCAALASWERVKMNGSLGACRIVKLVRALRKGWIKADRGAPPEEPPAYLLWADDGLVAEKTANGVPGADVCLARMLQR